ncbi:MAG: hypothetical protein IJV29_13590 [Butyrivibrio sp.]|nr:hypothetical protein [Butyrivibrio sp.]
MAKIDLEKWICSMIECFPDFKERGKIPCMYEQALKDQGLEYKNGQIVETKYYCTGVGTPKEAEGVLKEMIHKPLEIKAGQWYMCVKDYQFAEHDDVTFKKGDVYKSERDGFITASDGGKWPFGDAKDYFRPATEDEIPNNPKFKVGDFIIDKGDHEVFQVMNVLDNTYEIAAIDDGPDYDMPYYAVEKACRLWTIQDARDGDVLYNNESESICVLGHFDGIADKYNSFVCRFGIEGKGLAQELSINGFHDNSIGYIPATQSQKEKLFKAVAEAGYEWDAETKKLVDPIEVAMLKKDAAKILSLARKQIVKEIDPVIMSLEWMENNPGEPLESVAAYRQGILDTLEKIKV